MVLRGIWDWFDADEPLAVALGVICMIALLALICTLGVLGVLALADHLPGWIQFAWETYVRDVKCN